MSGMFRALRRIAIRILVAMLGLQLATAVGLVLIDRRRKHRSGPATFPTSQPADVEIVHNRARVYTYGQDVYDDMIAAIDAATDRICFETFIWKSDDTGQAVKDALIRAADRGVTVRVVWDVFANLVVPRSFFDFPDNIITKGHPLVMPGLMFWHPRNTGRNHRKILVIDGQVGFVGGYNIGSVYATDWRDTHLRLTGPAALDLENAFIDYWNMRPDRDGRLPEVSGRKWDSSLDVVRNVPPMRHHPIRGMYLEFMDRADERIWLTHAYFVPDEAMAQALIDAVARGVDVRVILPRRSNHIVADWVSRGYYRRLLRAGVRLFLYENAMVHSKTALVDEAWATIGTANLDPLSLQGNFEINVSLIDPAMARTMAEVFELDLSNCHELTLADWQRRPVTAKFSEAVLKPLAPFV